MKLPAKFPYKMCLKSAYVYRSEIPNTVILFNWEGKNVSEYSDLGIVVKKLSGCKKIMLH